MSTHLEALVRAIWTAPSRAAIYQETVVLVKDLLDADSCELAIADDGTLVTRAVVPEDGTTTGEALDPTSLPAVAFRRDESCLVEDCTDVRRATSPECSVDYTPVPAMLAVPFGDVGVLVARSATPGQFDEDDKRRVQQLCTVTATVLEEMESQGPPPERRLSEVTDILSHDLSSPLQVAYSRLELVAETADIDEHLPHAERALAQIESLIDDIVLLARTDELVADQEPVDLQTAAERTWDGLITERATLEVVGNAVIMADASSLHHMLANLFRNAVDHNDGSLTVYVGTTSNGFFVADSGCGISPERQETVLEWGTSNAAGHSGLGLGIVARIVDEHGWEIEIGESETGGARFDITGVEFS